MRFEFEEIDLVEHSGDVMIRAESEAEVKEVADHFRLFKDDVRGLVAALDAGTLTHRLTAYSSLGNRYRWFEVHGSLDIEFSEPYLALLVNRTGLDTGGILPDLDLQGPTLRHTHYAVRVWIEQGHICFIAYDSATEWNGRDAATNAEAYVSDYLKEAFGVRHHEPEFIANRAGTYSRNPNYLKRHRPKPAASNKILKDALFQWWLGNHANEAQRAVIASAVQCHDSNRTPFKGFDEYHIHYDNWKASCTWAELMALPSNQVAHAAD
jgi:hypothetical protein